MRSLLNDVSLSELQELRAEGLSNREIAEKLDIGYQTVLKYLGKQPKRSMFSPAKWLSGAAKWPSGVGQLQNIGTVLMGSKTGIIYTITKDVYGNTIIDVEHPESKVCGGLCYEAFCDMLNEMLALRGEAEKLDAAD